MFSIDFERELLKASLKDNTYNSLFSHTDDSLFSLTENKIVFNALSKFFSIYGKLPLKYELEQFIKLNVKDLSNDLWKEVEKTLIWCYNTEYTPSDFLADTVISFVLSKKAVTYITAQDSFAQESDILNLKSNLESLLSFKDSFKGKEIEFFSTSFNSLSFITEKGYSGKFKSIDNSLVSGGFVPGEIAVFLSTAKAGKTTLMINMVEGYIKNGLKVLYVDTENGRKRMYRMMYQNLLKCTYKDLKRGYFVKEAVKSDPVLMREFMTLEIEWIDSSDINVYKEMLNYVDTVDFLLNGIFSNIKSMGGDLVFYFLPPRSTPLEVERFLNRLKNNNFVPDIVFVDYFDNFSPSGKVFSEKRFNIQDVYLSFKSLSDKFGFVCITPSQANRSAVGRDMIDESFLAEDYQKAAHANYIFVFIRTEDMKYNNKGLLKLVAARDGVDHNDPFELYCDMPKVDIYELNENSTSFIPETKNRLH